jgi:FkbM family methyltransferase
MMTASPAYATDADVIKAFPRYQGPGVPGCIVDFLGTKTRLSYLPAVYSGRSGVVEDYPLVGNFHSHGFEWAGALRAVLDAATELTVVELGAGWGPWLVALARAAHLRGIRNVRLVGVEGSREHFEFLRSHFADNGLDPEQHTLHHAIVGAVDGEAHFPILTSPSENYGSAPVSQEKRAPEEKREPEGVARRFLGRLGLRKPPAAGPSTDGVELNGVERVDCLSLPTLLRPLSRVDLIHFDIQGGEYEVISSARQVLKEKVKRLVIGTHSRSIEQNLLDELASQSWVLEAEHCCVFQQDGRKMNLYRDGCQTWRNPDLLG